MNDDEIAALKAASDNLRREFEAYKAAHLCSCRPARIGRFYR